ncbi:hypothetical protein FB45DRAFT_832127 [Roridomyces roridus]|uniref:Ubiquitin thioesterase OTU n=1 Tax=Roridomyces roridus TaxID=1738132 RepID=A0AAD7BWX9_9AGAR|nr:hypothetical protein FB45DRAFT_832127 [Roridomyces roridus]
MTPIRLRHPQGVSTIQVNFDEDFKVQDLQQEIYAATDILPSRQTLKTGYPPIALEIVPELPISSLGLKASDQIIVSENAPAPAAPNPAPAPTAALPTPRTAPTTSGPDAVEVDGSFLIHRIVPDDNACLFASVALIFEQDMKKAQKMRQLVADGIKRDPETYNEAILGMPPATYISKILTPATWGGAIELGILASHFRTEIASIDVETGRIDQFAPSGVSDPENRCLVIYSGIHYDAATLAPMADAPSDWHQTVFPTRSADILDAAKRLADILRAKRAFTNTATFDLKCEQCGQGLKGEKGAQAHAKDTGHTRFGEY